jgi:hypothetical protein
MRTIVPWWASGAFGTLEDVHQPRSTARSIAIAATLTASAVLVGCTATPAVRSVTLELDQIDGSGVSGSVVITEVDATTTLITVDADPAGHPDMPAHVHPGSCAQLIPQPRFALENIVDGHSSTRVPASFEELTVPGQAINLHESNTALDVYTACVDL